MEHQSDASRVQQMSETVSCEAQAHVCYVETQNEECVHKTALATTEKGKGEMGPNEAKLCESMTQMSSSLVDVGGVIGITAFLFGWN